MKQAKEENSSRVSSRLQEIYAGKYGYRKTATGRWRENDEPDEITQFKQADAIRKSLQARKAAQSRDRLKTANKVPTRKDGRKLFEIFCREATNRIEKDFDDADMKCIINAAKNLSYEDWIWYVANAYGSRIK